MGDLKTKPTDESVDSFINEIEDDKKRKESRTILNLMKKITGEDPKMWGPGIIGFGSYHYQYDSGREGDWFLTGFSPRKRNFSLYIMAGFDQYKDLLQKLGKHKTGKSCLYVNKLEDIDLQILEELVSESVAHVKEKYN